MKKFFLFSTIGIALFILAAFIDILQFSIKPASSNNNEKIINIKPRQSLDEILTTLYDNSLITSKIKAKILARFENCQKSVKAGEYLLSESMTPKHIFEILIKGKVYLHKITIPEGLNIKQTARIFSQKGFCKEETFIKIAENDEGYLFPDTYFFAKNDGCYAIIKAMKNKFFSVFTDEWKKQAAQMGFNVHQIVTLASIIEKETAAKEERMLISSVFHNRLEKHMRLQSDPTVIYGIKNFDGNLKKKHLLEYNTYNTYKIRGLPQGPIANPGANSLYAALFPEKTDYYYFVSKKDGTHKFSKTIKEHNKAVVKYQLQ